MKTISKIFAYGGALAILTSPFALTKTSFPLKLDEIIVNERYSNNNKVVIMQEHREAYYYWKKSEFEGFIGRDNVLVLVDSHSDDGRWNINYNLNEFIRSEMGLQEKLVTTQDYIDNKLVPLKDGKHLAFMPLNNASYIWPGVEYDKLINEVYWIVPELKGDYIETLLRDNRVEFGEIEIPFNVRTIDDLEDLRNRKVLLTIDLDFWYLGYFQKAKSSFEINAMIEREIPSFLCKLNRRIGNPVGYITVARTIGLSDLKEKEQRYLEDKVLECLKRY